MIDLAYSIFGNGFPLVFLHGYLENRYLWNEFIQNFENNTCICFDLPGCGETPPIEEQTIDKMAEAVKYNLDKLNIKNIIIIGHSMGGYVSLSFAKNYPDYLKGLVLMNSHPFADTAEKKQNRMQEIDLINIGKKSLLLSNFIQKLYAPDFNDQEKIEKSRTMAELTCPKGMIACLKAMANRTDCSEVIHNAKYPILWIYGKKDQLFNYELADNFITQNNRLIKLKLDNVGHMSMFEAKDEVTKALKQFIDLCL